jgi:hypothetical protein
LPTPEERRRRVAIDASQNLPYNFFLFGRDCVQRSRKNYPMNSREEGGKILHLKSAIACFVFLSFVSSANAQGAFDGRWYSTVHATLTKSGSLGRCGPKGFGLSVRNGRVSGVARAVLFYVNDQSVKHFEILAHNVRFQGARAKLFIGFGRPFVVLTGHIPILGNITADGRLDGTIGDLRFEGIFSGDSFVGKMDAQFCSDEIRLIRSRRR